MQGRLFLDVVVRLSSSCLPTKIRSWTLKDEMEGRLFLDVVVRLELLADENKELDVEGRDGG
jgi:hypothetical protein